MIRRLAILGLLALATGPAIADPATDTNFPLRVRYWQNYRSRQRTTRYGYPPDFGTNWIAQGYTVLEYVECTGPQWVDTLCKAKATTRIDAKWTQVEITSQQQRLWGIRETDTNYFDLFWKSSKWQGRFFGSTSVAIVAAAANTTYTVRADAQAGTITINGTTVSLGTTPNKETAGTIPIFGRRNDGSVSVSYPSKMKLHWFQIRENGVLVRDFVPVKNANNVAGLLDLCSGAIHYSATSTPLVAGPELLPTTVLPSVDRETVRGMLAPPEGAARQAGEVWLDCLAIPEGSWLVERPVAGGGTAWCAALCESNALRAVVWRYATGVGPTNLPVTLEHDPARPIGRVEGLYYEQGTGVVARISVSRAGWDWARTNRCVSPSPWIRCADTNLVVRTDGWRHEHQDYIEARCVPRGEDMSSVTNVPASTSCLVLYPLYFRGLSLVRTPLLPTYVEREVPDHLRNAYPVNPRRQWDWR